MSYYKLGPRKVNAASVIICNESQWACTWQEFCQANAEGMSAKELTEIWKSLEKCGEAVIPGPQAIKSIINVLEDF